MDKQLDFPQAFSTCWSSRPRPSVHGTATVFCCASSRFRKIPWKFSKALCTRLLYRLEHQGRITSEWGGSENSRRAKYYRPTAAGQRRLQAEADKWNRMADVIAGIFATTPEEV
jgi:hypothetical protein